MGNLVVLAEYLRGAVADVTFELLGKARELGNLLGLSVEVVVVSDRQPDDVTGRLGPADRAWLILHPDLGEFQPEGMARALAAFLGERRPRLVLTSTTAFGMDVAAGIGGLLGWPVVAYCSALQVADRTIIATSQVYGGKVLVEVEIPDEPTVIAALPGSFPAPVGPSAPAAVEIWEPAGLQPARLRLRRWVEPEAADVDITRAEILVVAGRGIKSADNLPLIEELARALGGVVAASRPVVDAGWLPRNRQVGKSGLTVRPRLYLGLGVSGAPEHLEGMKDSQFIVAINTDRKAPIFDVAHYGVVGDIFEVVPALIERLRPEGH